jgi:adenosine kinase
VTALVCGSLAFDTIMVFKDRFKDHILPDKVHMLNVAFLVPELRREFGGCAGNVSYNLMLLGGDGYPLGTVGDDFGPYAEWMDTKGVSRRYVQTVPGTYSAQAYITSDLDDNQITAFHPGAMAYSSRISVPADAKFTLGMVSPDSRDGMLAHAEQFSAAGIPFVFDPGQALPQFDGAELRHLISRATWIAVNDYECEMLRERTEWSPHEMAQRVRALIVTRGAQGSSIFVQGKSIEIPAARTVRIADPTGCGDAYRAGLLYGLMNDMDWETTGRIASLAGAAKIENYGTQNHSYTQDEFRARFEENFGYPF